MNKIEQKMSIHQKTSETYEKHLTYITYDTSVVNVHNQVNAKLDHYSL